MSMIISEEKNNGYPSIPELTDNFTVIHTAPFWDFSMKLSAKHNNGYPVMLQIPVLARKTAMKPVFPDFYMHCLGNEFNSGYPCILKLEHIERTVFLNVFFGNSKGIRLFFNGKEINTAYCNGQKICGTAYTST